MSNISYIRYPEDPSGKSPDNLVTGERHTMLAKKVRVVVPTNAYFFADSVKVWDAVTMRPLVKGTDFSIAHFNLEAGLKYGQSVAAVVVIINEAVSSEILIDYQVVGGTLVSYIDEITRMYELIMNDKRPIDWVNIEGKPQEYNPSLHKHLLADIVGFEPVVFQLERLAQAITLSNIPAFEALIDWVQARVKETATDQEVIDAAKVEKYITLRQLSVAAETLNFNTIRWTLDSRLLMNGSTLGVQLEATNMYDNGLLYWTIEHISTQPEDFYAVGGIVYINEHIGNFNVQLLPNRSLKPEASEQFRIVLRRTSMNGEIVARSPKITVAKYTGEYTDYVSAAVRCCLMNPKVNRNARSMFLLGT